MQLECNESFETERIFEVAYCLPRTPAAGRDYEVCHYLCSGTATQSVQAYLVIGVLWSWTCTSYHKPPETVALSAI